jgi:signal transduction histidine kinase
VTEEVAQVFNLDGAHLHSYSDDDTTVVLAGWSRDGRTHLGAGTRLPLEGDNLVAQVFEAKRPVRMDDYADARGPIADLVRALGIRSAVGAPIVVDGRLWGVMVASSNGGPIPAGTELRIAAFAELAATAIANGETRRELERVAAEQAALRRVATIVAQGATPEDVFAAVSREIARVVEVAISALVRFEDHCTATVVAGFGEMGQWPIGSTWPLDDGDSVLARVYTTRRPARLDSYEHSTSALADLARRAGRTSSVGAPIMIDDCVWGAAVVSALTGRLPRGMEDRIESFADLIAVAISNAENRDALQASRARVVATADATRKRIERDLHDGLQQRLVSLALTAHRTASAGSADPNGMREQLTGIAGGLSEMLDDLREIARGIHPAILSEAGLGPALKALARRSAVHVDLDVQLDRRLEETTEAAAYYVTSEALANAVKHADATGVEVSVSDRDGVLALTISDDGVGGADPGGSGLTGLRDRVDALGGKMSVVSPPGEGTRIDVQLPIELPVG